MTDSPKVLVGVPTYKYLPASSALSLVGCVIDCANRGILAHFDGQADMYVTTARNQICETALKLYKQGTVTHLWFIDDDMVIKQGTIANLLARNVDVVGSAYYGRNLRPIAYDIEPFKFRVTLPSFGLHQVDGLGCGCLLLRCEILERMAKHFGDAWWFQNTIVENAGNTIYLGEDVFFFRRLKEMGIPVYMDCDSHCGHMGAAIIDINTVRSQISVFVDNVLIARERHFSKLHAEAVATKQAVCHPGCTDCCHKQRVLVDAVDGIIAYSHLNRCQRWTESLKSQLIEEDHFVAESAVSGYDHPCIFLSNGFCSIYQARPACCGYCFGSKAENCTDSGSVFAIAKSDDLHAKTAKDLVTMLELPPKLFTLPGAILFAERLLEGMPPPEVWSAPLPL